MPKAIDYILRYVIFWSFFPHSINDVKLMDYSKLAPLFSEATPPMFVISPPC